MGGIVGDFNNNTNAWRDTVNYILSRVSIFPTKVCIPCDHLCTIPSTDTERERERERAKCKTLFSSLLQGINSLAHPQLCIPSVLLKGREN